MVFKGYSFRLHKKYCFVQCPTKDEAYRTWTRYAHPSFLFRVYAFLAFEPCEITVFESVHRYEAMVSTYSRRDLGNLRDMFAELWLHDVDDADGEEMGFGDVKQLGLLEWR